MARAFVLMTALPPTKGHLHLIQWADSLADEGVRVLVCTQPFEPFAQERFDAIRQAFSDNENVRPLHWATTLPQDPATPGFWDLWKNIMIWLGVKTGDYIVSSEPYGQTLADLTGGIFMPYDPGRELYYCKGTEARLHLREQFDTLIVQFQSHLRQTVTLFGAESTGKTTLSKALAKSMNGHWLFEWARPYLETVGPEINVPVMEAIWRGQRASQLHTKHWHDKPFVVQDTDLFSTVGYWQQPHWQADLGECPDGLINDAVNLKSDLYLITQANIPFEQDEIRYGDGVRESPDDYWIGIADRYNLNYKVIKADNLEDRMVEAQYHMNQHFEAVAQQLDYDRKGF